MSFSAVILAGGQSRRIGRDKAFMPMGGRTLLARQIETVKLAGAAHVYISGRRDACYDAFPYPVLYDEEPSCGPLSGIIMALKQISSDHLLVLAIDLPHMPPSYLVGLFAACAPGRGAVPKHARGYEPLAAFYPRKLLSLAEKAREQEDYSLQHLVARAMAQPQIIAQVVTPETCSHFQNANSPAEFDLPELVRCSRKGT